MSHVTSRNVWGDTGAPDTAVIGRLGRLVKLALSKEQFYRESLDMPVILKDSDNIDRWTISNVTFSGPTRLDYAPNTQLGGSIGIDTSFTEFYGSFLIPNFSISGSIDETLHTFSLLNPVDVIIHVNLTDAPFWSVGFINDFSLNFNPSVYQFQVNCSSPSNDDECNSVKEILENSSQLNYSSLRTILHTNLKRRVVMEFTRFFYSFY